MNDYSYIKVYLGSHANKEYIFKVILKISGNKFVQIGNDNVDKNKHSDEDNKWEIKFIKKNKNRIIPATLIKEAYFFEFEDCTKETHSITYFSNANYLLSKPETLLIVIGKRLVDFFGGEIFFYDANLKYSCYFCDNPKYPQKTEKESDYDQWFRFQNVLFNEQAVKKQELKDMKNKVKYLGVKEFITYLEKCEAAQELANYLPLKNKTINKQLKI